VVFLQEFIATTKNFQLRRIHFLFLLSFLIWGFCFRGFLFGHLSLSSDALAYYGHFKYFVDQIFRGVYPLWESNYASGIPIEFYLRRIGSFNPFIFFLVLFHKIFGISYFTSYVMFLGGYYFVGMVGFYLLTKRLFGDQRIAFIAYLLLMFSSLGTRLFDSYILLTCIPMIWFFYFLLAFVQDQQKHFFLGLAFTLMILVTTYLPFYFFIIFTTFLIFSVLIFSKESLNFVKKSILFFKGNKFFVTVCLFAVLFSLIPGILFFVEGKSGEIILSNRHGDAQVSHTMGVALKTITSWGIEEDLFYSLAFEDLRKFKFALFYLPFFAYVIFVLGLFSKIDRKLLLLFLSAFSLFVMFAHHLPVYRTLYKHIFFFKYFRNLHFFLWMAILPIFILFLARQLQVFLGAIRQSNRNRGMMLLYITLIHVCLAYILMKRDYTIVSTYISLGLSFIFFIFLWINRSKNTTFPLIIVMASIVVQPVEVYQYLNENVKKSVDFIEYNKPYLSFYLPTEKEVNIRPPNIESLANYAGKKTENNYLSLKWFEFLQSQFNHVVFNDYRRYKLLVYDRTIEMSDEDIDINRLGRSFAKRENIAFVSSNEAVKSQTQYNMNFSDQFYIVKKDDPFVKLLNFDTNYLRLKTNFNQPKYLVYNDNYHTQWQASINGKPTQIFRTNVSFKGIWLPAGENIVLFRFGETWRYILNFFLLGLFYCFFIYLLYLSFMRSSKSI